MSTTSTTTAPLLKPFGPNIWIAEGPVVNFFGFPYPTRCVIIKLSNGSLWVWSPIALSGELWQEVRKLGNVQHLIAPNQIHWLFLKDWHDMYPNAKLHAAPGLVQRKVVQDLSFDAELSDNADPNYADDISQVVFQGSLMDEVVFFHHESKTVIFCDLIQRFPDGKGFKNWLMKLDGLVGPNGSTPREWRLSFYWNGQLHLTRKALDKVLFEWKPDRLVIAHGDCAKAGGTQIVEQCLSWIPIDPGPPKTCCCIPRRVGNEEKSD